MSEFSGSRKFHNRAEQIKVTSEGFVLLRAVPGAGTSMVLMTATAGEDDQALSAYPDQTRLMSAARQELADLSSSVIDAKDGSGRPYVEFHINSEQRVIQKAVDRMAVALGLQAPSDLSRIYDNLSDAAGYDGRVYLSDGVYLDADENLSS